MLVLQGLDPSVTGLCAARPYAEQIKLHASACLHIMSSCTIPLLQSTVYLSVVSIVCCPVEVSASD
jgi:hypothetical protein